MEFVDRRDGKEVSEAWRRDVLDVPVELVFGRTERTEAAMVG